MKYFFLSCYRFLYPCNPWLKLLRRNCRKMLKNRQNDGCITLAGVSGEHSVGVIGQKIFSGGANDSVRPRAGNSGGEKAGVMVAPETPVRQMTVSRVRRKSRRG
jgi:hypothetical protein